MSSFYLSWFELTISFLIYFEMIDVLSMLVESDYEGVTVVLHVIPDVDGNPAPPQPMPEGEVPPIDHEMEDAEDKVP